MWRAKERERGFNQAEILAEHVVKSLPGVSRKVDMLERVRETKPMFGLTRKARSENIADAFRIINNQISIIKQQKVILVDDVWTTGSTMRECAKMLKQSGVREIWALALAR
ncbi:MAG: phosphoribosyltransferase family protein [Microgenomates group bacterium]